MPRPRKCRFVQNFPNITVFMPSGKNDSDFDSVIIGYEELEALRLADFEAKKQDDAAIKMNVSRATFGRIVERARFLVADALLNGKAIIIKGGDFCCKDLSVNYPNVELSVFYLEKRKKCLNCIKYRNECFKYANSNESNFSKLSEDKMSNNFKIAVVSDDGVNVNQHFGSSRYYEVFTVQNGQITKRERLEKQSFHAPGQHHHHDEHYGSGAHGNQSSGIGYQQHGMMHGTEHDSGHKHNAMISNIADCNYLISRGMGNGIYYHLEAANIKPIVTNIKNVEESVKALIDGTIINHPEKLH